MTHVDINGPDAVSTVIIGEHLVLFAGQCL